MHKIKIYFLIGLILLISGTIITQFAGHRHLAKGMILMFAGFILSSAFGLTLFQVRKQQAKRKKPEDVLDPD
ncbi:hypothetical protein [Fluviicola sp.]|uniref:hypothetical protein n=1 Tax=Fluviicola sp. TaxID=1917219 RepID=UPI0031D9F90D